jgi:hypothetical protein
MDEANDAMKQLRAALDAAANTGDMRIGRLRAREAALAAMAKGSAMMRGLAAADTLPKEILLQFLSTLEHFLNEMVLHMQNERREIAEGADTGPSEGPSRS